MPTRIPLPGNMIDTLMSGVKTGGNLFTQIMHPRLEREKQQQLEEHFQEQLKLQKAAAGRAAQNASDAHKLAMMKLDPLHDAKQIEAIENYFRDKEQAGGSDNSSNMPGQPNDGYPALAKMFEGQGAFPGGELKHGNVNLFNRPTVDNPETGGQSTVWSMSFGTPEGEVLVPRVSDDGRILTPDEAKENYYKTGKHLGIYSSPDEANHAAEMIHQQQEQLISKPTAKKAGGIDLDLIKAHPMLRGWYKKHYGYDPLAPIAQTPEEKDASAINLFKRKEEIKAESKSGDTATNKILTQNQQAVQAIDTVIPMIDDLINNPDKIYGPFDYSPSKRAAYNAKTGGMIDMLVAAQSLPQVKESVNLVEEQIRRGTGESKDAYRKRLKDFKEDLLARKSKSVKVVNSKKVDTSIVIPEETKTIDGVKYEKINGEWHVAN